MKKSIFLLMISILFLMSCREDNTVIITNNLTQTELVDQELSSNDLWYVGKTGKSDIHIRLTILDSQVVGEYYLDQNDKTILRGHIEGEVIYLKGDHEFYLTEENDTFIGVMISDEVESVYASKNPKFKPMLTRESSKLQGLYKSVEGNYFSHSSIRIVPLFETYIYAEISAKNGEVTDSKATLLRENDHKYRALTDRYTLSLYKDEYHNMTLTSQDLKFKEGIEVGQVYSESHRYASPKLDMEYKERLMALLGDDYQVFLNLLQERNGDFYELYGGPKAAMIVSENDLIYIAINERYYEDHKVRLFTNAMDYIPEKVQSFIGQNYVIKASPILRSGMKLPQQGQENDFILPGYHVMDKAKGYLNKDDYEDLVLILEGDVPLMIVLEGHESGYKLVNFSENAILLPNEGGLWGNPYEDCSIENNLLELSFYGGSNYRWAYSYVFDPMKAYKLISVETMDYFTGDGSFEILEYNLLNQSVIRSKGNSLDEIKSPHIKIKIEEIYLRSFDVRNNIDYEYN